MRRLLLLAVFLGGCTFDPDLGGDYFPCKPDGTCPGKCVCLEGQICVPEDSQGPDSCAWCKDDQTLCREGQEVRCAHLDFDAENCGECGNLCQLPNATSDCIEGICVIIECLDCYEDCDQLDSTGCETCPETDPNNCGECGKGCYDPPPAVCEGDDLRIYLESGNCVSSACDYPSSLRPCNWGCESGFCKEDPCLQVNCNLHQHCEDGACVCNDLYGDCDTNNLNGCETYLSTLNDCGECGFSCGPKGICAGGVCDCDYGFENCNGVWSDGCETDILFDEQNCGTCTDPCEAGLTCCDGTCVDTNTDRGNCGGCMTFCIGMTECCLGTCEETQLDPENCGSCGNVCQAPESTCCWGTCTDLTSDAGNCGECGKNCAMNIPCHQGACGAQGIYCGTQTCDFWLEQCCYGAGGIACYPAANCSVRVVECDEDSDCGDSLYCCLVNTPEHITMCTATCTDYVCSSDAYCTDTDPGNPHCCSGDYYGQLVNSCSSEFCQ